MFVETLRLVVALNTVAAGVATLPAAEHALLAGGLVMHATDPDEALGLGDGAHTLRVALTRAVRAGSTDAGGRPPAWAVALPRHGRAGGLRGPRELTARALELGAPVALPHTGGAAWLGLPLGHPEPEAVQWRVWRADRPVIEATPSEAARSFTAALADAAEALTDLGVTGGTRPDSTLSVRLGPAYPSSSQVLLDRALVVHAACVTALDQPETVLHSHGVLTRERVLAPLVDTCLEAVQAACSWPLHAMR
ncbi:hypothetical protein ACSDQ9_11530 [Aestuariimicrobium soli]|uniref:hypothetical protein n=1 Tax=Aestuariimicrobium soli TaxID=2035834 RepID=UPI003EBF1CA2